MNVAKITLITLLVVLSASPVLAGDWGAGASLFDGDNFGVQARKTFVLGGDISQITTGASIYFDNTWFAFDADYHFVINAESPSRFYPLVGLELATDFSWAELGLNLGGGVDFMLTDTLAAYFEAKLVVSDLDGFVATLGVKF
ncbi:hypothetical protein DRQ50_11975 [bacterium]|nr:MAG: hypothetical protein DRQ50_11975 [bacterium]